MAGGRWRGSSGTGKRRSQKQPRESPSEVSVPHRAGGKGTVGWRAGPTRSVPSCEAAGRNTVPSLAAYGHGDGEHRLLALGQGEGPPPPIRP